MDNYKDLLGKGLEHGFDDCEVYASHAQSRSARIIKGDVAQYENSQTGGISFRGNLAGCTGYAYSEKPDAANWPELIEDAAQNAEISTAEESDEIYDGDMHYPKYDGYQEELSMVTSQELIEMGLTMEKTALAQKYIKSVDACVAGYGESNSAIENSNGLRVSFASNYVIAYLSATASNKGQVKTGFDYWVGTDLSQFDPVALAKAAAAEAAANLGAKSIPSGQYAVLFKNTAIANLLQTYCGIFFADTNQKGFSMLQGKMGQKIASPHVTIQDDRAVKGNILLPPYDSEGVLTKDKAVIKEGVLKCYLHNLKSARKDGVLPTGNGSRGIKSPLGISALNFYIKPAQATNEALQKEIGDGLYITDLSGLHAGANTVSGDFSLMASGFLIEGGCLTQPVEQITVAGNFLTLLKDIEAVGNDLRFLLPSGKGIIGAPSVLVRVLSVSGL